MFSYLIISVFPFVRFLNLLILFFAPVPPFRWALPHASLFPVQTIFPCSHYSSFKCFISQFPLFIPVPTIIPSFLLFSLLSFSLLPVSPLMIVPPSPVPSFIPPFFLFPLFPPLSLSYLCSSCSHHSLSSSLFRPFYIS